MKQFVSDTFRLHQLLPLALLVLASFWIVQSGRDIWASLQALQWPAKTPELPGEPVQPAPLSSAVSLAATRDRPLFWEGRRPPPPVGAGTAASAEQPRLLGLVMESGQVSWVVLSQGTPPQRKVFRLKVGQAIGGYTVKAARPDEVVLLGPAGEIPLRPPRLATP